MLQVQIASNNSTLFLHSSPFARGGEGLLYEVISPKKYKGYIVKIYHPEKRSIPRAKKIAYLVDNPPLFAQDNAQSPVAWPLAAITERGAFVGFLMRKVAGKSLEILCTPKLPKGLDKEWQRLDFSRSEARELRQKICFNLAVALQHIHAAQCYAFVDLKPDNILIQPNGLVSLVDMDSIEISENGRLLFAAPVATPDYTPPEHYAIPNSNWGKRESWDRFSMAVIFYKVLLGIHPYAASCGAPFEKADSLAAKIEVGLFVHHPSKNQYLSVIPALHKHFSTLPKALQDCFMQCFAHGHEQSDVRPTSEEWCWALAGEIGQEVRNDVSYLPFVSTLQSTLWPVLPPCLSSNLPAKLLLYAKTLQGGMKLNFKLNSPNMKRYFWVGKQTKEEWIRLKNQLGSDLDRLLDLEKWTLQEKAMLAQWLSEELSNQNILKADCSKKLLDAKQTHTQVQSEFEHQLRQVNRKLAKAIQKSHQQKRKAYLTLTENHTWQGFRGNSLSAKLWHLSQKQQKEIYTIKEENLRLRSEGERSLNQAMNRIEAAYYQSLEEIELSIKEKREKARKSIQEAYEKNIEQNVDYQYELKKSADVKAAYADKLKLLQNAYSALSADLDRQFQEQLLSKQDTLKEEAVVNTRLLAWRTQKTLLEEMLKIQQNAAKAKYLEEKKELEAEYNTAVIQWESGFKAFYIQKKKELELTHFKEPLQACLNDLQQELQRSKAKKEEEYLKNRALCQTNFLSLKEALVKKEIREIEALNLSSSKKEAALKVAYELYQAQVREAEEQLLFEYERLSNLLAAEKNRLQNRIAIELAQLTEYFDSVKSNFEMNWTATLGSIGTGNSIGGL